MVEADAQADYDANDYHIYFNHVTATLSDLDLEMIHAVTPGGNWNDIPLETAKKSKRLMQIRDSGGRTTYYGRLRSDLPSYTISTYFNRPGNGTFIHPEKDRLISIREAARLQSFTDDFRFYGSLSSQYKQIGNAVPPLLARAIGRMITPTRAIDLFSGAGGMSRGLIQAGHEMKIAADINNHMLETYKQNHNQTICIKTDFSDQSERSDLIDRTNNILGGRTLGLLAAGPPCQGFSTAGNRKENDPRNSLLFSILEIIDELCPEFLLIENVLGLLWMRNGMLLDSFMEELSSMGYASKHHKLYAEQYGVPQRRRRVFIMASRSDKAFPAPEPIFSRAMTGRTREHIQFKPGHLARPVSVGEAINDIPDVSDDAINLKCDIDCIQTSSEYQRLMRKEISYEQFIKSRSKKA